MGGTLIPIYKEGVVSQSPTFFLDVIRCLPFVRSAKLDIFAIPFDTIKIESEKPTEKNPLVINVMDEVGYESECIRNNVIPYSRMEMRYDKDYGSNGEFISYGNIEMLKTKAPSFLFESGGRPAHIELSMGDLWGG